MDLLPSYQEATSRVDWLQIIAPYISSGDYHALCLVNRRFWKVFSPRLWVNLIKAVRRRGLDPSDDLSWWLDFVFVRLSSIRQETRDLVRILDLGSFAVDSYQFATDQNARFLNSLHLALKLLPRLNALVLDQHTEIDPNTLVSLTATHANPLLLSIRNCSMPLYATFYSSPSLQKLVYLDISYTPGSIRPLLQPMLLPDLRILKIRGKELDDATFKALASLYRLRLWSLDLSHNLLTDAAVSLMLDNVFSAKSIRSHNRFEVEGRLSIAEYGTTLYGPFVSVLESASSASFTHPERYFLDVPAYAAEPHVLHGHQVTRSDGRVPVRLDTVDGAAEQLTGENSQYYDGDAFRTSHGITHISLPNCQISSHGVQQLLRNSKGHIEYLACDFLPLLTAHTLLKSIWPQSSRLFGILGSTHLFRPVFSSNLRAIRIHHSLVTNIPTLKAKGLSILAECFLAETKILPRADKAYPCTFVPDANPRVASLTLTCIPRRSSGPLISRLLNFLKLLSAQERSIQDASRIASSWRWPGMLKGLRHLSLEFDVDPMEEGFSTTEDLDAEKLLASGDRGFSFFDDDSADTTLLEVKAQQAKSATIKMALERSELTGASKYDAAREPSEFQMYDGHWNGARFSIPVWTGTSLPHANPIINEYRRLVLEKNLKGCLGPVTNEQVQAGAPEKSYIYHTAWCAAIMPRQLLSPALDDLAGMRDVLNELKAYRASGRQAYQKLKATYGNQHVPLGDPHYFWTGRLDVSTKQPPLHV